MLTAITEKTRIDGLQKRLTKKLVEGGTPRTIDYGHKGEKTRGNKAWWYRREKFWWCYHPPEGQSWWRHRVPEAGLTRHWNGFGHAEECHDGKEYSITCEINFKREHDWTVAGTFARDEDDVVYIVHTGKIGGGRKGVSMKLFKQKYAGSG